MGKFTTSKLLLGTAVLGLVSAAAYTFVKKYQELAPKAIPEKGPDGEEITPATFQIDMDAAKKAAGETATVLSEQAKKFAHAASESAKAVGGVIRENYGTEIDSAKKAASEKFAEAKEFAAEKFATAKEYAGEKWEQAKEAAGEKWEQAKEFVQTKVQEFKDRAEEEDPNETAETASVDELFDEVKEKAEEALNEAEEAVEETAENAEKKTEDFIQNL